MGAVQCGSSPAQSVEGLSHRGSSELRRKAFGPRARLPAAEPPARPALAARLAAAAEHAPEPAWRRLRWGPSWRLVSRCGSVCRGREAQAQ
eukprot:scaffold517_cov255-Pinguiococcus_pyrenoidosus.AAC.21